MPQKLIIILLLTLAATGFVLGQTVSPAKTDEADEKLRKEAVIFLRETVAEVGAMRSLENRISFGAELASLMWLHDAKEGRQMYSQLVSDYQTLAVGLDAKLNEIAAAEAVENDDDTSVTAGLFADPTAKMLNQRKMTKALEMRKQIALSLAEHEPDMALDFYNGSVALLTSAYVKEAISSNDRYFELQLMTQIAEGNAAKAAQLAMKSLDEGVNFQHIELLKKVYAKDAEKGIELAAAMSKKIRSSKESSMESYVVASLVNFAEETTAKPAKGPAKKPLMSFSEIRDLVEFMAARMLAGEDDGGGVTSNMDLFEKYTPTRAAQIKAKIRGISVNSGGYGTNAGWAGNMAANAMANAANAMANTAYNSASPAETAALERRAKAAEARLEAEKKLMEDVASLTTKPLPKEERDKIITQARKIITKTPGREQRITALSMLAAQVAKAGDKELAGEIMKDAEAASVAQPKNYQDYMLHWMLISGYSDVNPDRAFTMLNETILRLNDTIAAFVKSAEFMDAQGEILSDDEVQVGQFGGSMLKSLTRELKIATPTLRNLTKANFEKTRAITNAFDRREVRVLAKMLIVRTVLDKDGDKDEAELLRPMNIEP
jgi:hypothetical protein